MAKKRKIESSSAAMRRNVAMVINETPTHSKTPSKLAVWMVRFFLLCVYMFLPNLMLLCLRCS
mgnify:FL=1